MVPSSDELTARVQLQGGPADGRVVPAAPDKEVVVISTRNGPARYWRVRRSKANWNRRVFMESEHYQPDIGYYAPEEVWNDEKRCQEFITELAHRVEQEDLDQENSRNMRAMFSLEPR